MMRYFNTEGLCEQGIYYMVRLEERLDKIKRLFVDQGKYFVINRGRQYGKTTTLSALEECLKNDYIVAFLDFQEISTAEYSDEYAFTKAFMRIFAETLGESSANVLNFKNKFQDLEQHVTLGEMFSLLSDFCKTAPKPVVLMVDEVDNASNNQVFIDFLAVLRSYYLKRKKKISFILLFLQVFTTSKI